MSTRMHEGASGKRTHLTIAYKQQTRRRQQATNPLHHGHIQPIVGSLSRHDLGGQGQSERIDGGHHDLDLQQIGIVFAMPQLEEAVFSSGMVA